MALCGAPLQLPADGRFAPSALDFGADTFDPSGDDVCRRCRWTVLT